MVTTLTLPALAFLMAISGIPGLSSIPWLRSIFHHKPHAAVVDTLPPRWKSSSLLALESSFLRSGLPDFGRVPGTIQLTQGLDPRVFKTSVEPDSGQWRGSIEVGNVVLGAPYRRPLEDFGSKTLAESFGERWRDTSRQKVNTGATGIISQHSGLSLKLPVQLPRIATSILGPGGPALNVSGSESIRLSGTSDWSNQVVGALGSQRSLFPSLDMQQDLNIQLEGQLSDRVKVNLLQNSANQVPLANLIAINYKGEEDDLVQELDLGNTNLSLPGTQYVSYSGRNEGLFGVKLATRLGPLDFTALASKQEGKSERASYSGGAQSATHAIQDLDYDKGHYFLLYDPQYTLLKIDDASIQIFRDDANYGNDTAPLDAAAMVDPGNKTGVPMDSAASVAAFHGKFDLLHPIDDYDILPDYYVLGGGLSFKIIRLKQPIQAGSEMCLAAAYTGTPVDPNGTPIGAAVTVGQDYYAGPDTALIGKHALKMLRAPRSLMKSADLVTFDPKAPFDAVRELEMKNFYQLGGYQIDPTSFKLSIQHGTDNPAVNYARLPNGTAVNYIEVLGLDNFDETMATRVKGHDEKVDGSAYQSGAQLFVDYANGVLWFPDPRPFAPRISASDSLNHKGWFDRLMNYNLNRRLRLDGPADSLNGANDFYDLYNPLPGIASHYNIMATFAAQRGGSDITLGRGNILAGSDVVTVNGERWTRDRDYSIDYDLGHVTLKRNLGPTDQLNVDYSYAPLFAQASKTLLGSAFSIEGRDRSFGGAFLYESQGAQDLRPRLGEEPSRTLITDLNTEWHFKPDFITKAVDKLPGVHTTVPSDLNVQAELGASFPNPNTMNEVYIDDMESVRDAVSLTLAPERWQLMSVPSRRTYNADGTIRQDFKLTDTVPVENQHMWNAELHWYYPLNTVKEFELKPNLSDAEGGQNTHQVLALSVPRFPSAVPAGVHPDSVWAGLTYQMDDRGIDLSRSQFIELWVNDFNDRHDPNTFDGLVRQNHLKLHIDLGVVSEDQMRAPNRPPNGILDTEDMPPRDHQLTTTPGHDEDTGIDGRMDDQEIAHWDGSTTPTYPAKPDADPMPIADLATATSADPEGDDWQNVSSGYQAGFHDIDPRHWLYTNGTEGNKTQYQYPNTEDMNLDNSLETNESYFEYTVDLGQSKGTGRYLVDDVSVDYASNSRVKTDNGWRRYRIPIADKLRETFGSPDLTIARHVRVWIDGLRAPDPTTASEVHPMLEIGGFDIVGSRWITADLTPAQKDTIFTTVTLNSVNSVDNADVYYPLPFDPGQALNGSQTLTRREQSMSLEFANLTPMNSIEAYRTFSIDEDYSRYGALTWYMAAYGILPAAGGLAFDAARDTQLNYFVRFASDERGENYYELRRRMPANSSARNVHWETIHVNLADMSRYKLDPKFPKTTSIFYEVPFGPDGDSLIINGRPSFTRLRRISYGLINNFPDPADSTHKYSGQMWMDEIRAVDVAKDVGLADRVTVGGHLANLASYNVAWNSRDANFLSVGDTRGSGNRQTSLAVTSTVEPERFFEGTGIQVPVSVVYNQTISKPRFSAGDDVVRTGAQQDASMTRNTSRTVSSSYSRVWSDRSSPLLRYSLGGLTANASRTQGDFISPTGVSNSVNSAASAGWGISPRRLLAIGMPLGKAKFYPLPDHVFASYNWNRSMSNSFTRGVDDPTQLVPSSMTNGTTAGLSMGADTRPFEFITHHIDATRSLSLTGLSRTDHFGGIDLGRTTAWRQNLSAHWTAQGGPWLQPNFTWTSNFNSAADLQSPDLSLHNVANGQGVQMNWTLPFDHFASTTAGGSHGGSSGHGPSSHGPMGGEPHGGAQQGAYPGGGGPQGAYPGGGGPQGAYPGGGGPQGAYPGGGGPQGVLPGGPGESRPDMMAGGDGRPPGLMGGAPVADAGAGADASAVGKPGAMPTQGVVTDSTVARGAVPRAATAPVAAPDSALVHGQMPGVAQAHGAMPGIGPVAAGASDTLAARGATPRVGPVAAADSTLAHGALPGIGSAPGAGVPAMGPAAPDTLYKVAVRPSAGEQVRAALAQLRTVSWRNLLSRVGNVQTDATVNRSSTYSRLAGMPSFLYAVGLVNDPGLSQAHQRVTLDPAGTTGSDLNWRMNARTRISLIFGAGITTRLSVGDRVGIANGVVNRSSDARFPDMDFEYGSLAEVIRLTRILQSPSLHTSWVHSTSADYRGSTSDLTGRSSSNDFHPLLALRGNLKNGTTTDLSVNIRNTVRDVSQFGTSTTTDNNMDLNLTVSRSYTAGQKIKFLGKSKVVKTNGSLQLATVYSHHTSDTFVPNSTVATRPINETRLSVTGTGNYGFSSSVNGSAVLGFNQTHDNTLDNLHRSVRVEVRAQFTF